ncbi:MAG: biotin/lipoyl-binding protein, partial [Lentisphaeria bacterium]|nr:biotin/lipoyl-binding protein [Lentisphaeria bacterium]
MKFKSLLFHTGEFLIGGAILAGVVFFCWKTGTERSVNSGRRKMEIPAVKIDEVKTSTVQARVEGIGTGLAKESVDITANATELVVGLYFEDGQTVVRGQHLVQLRDDQYQAELQQMRINLAEQERELKRLTPLYHARITAQKDYDAARTAVSRAKTAVGIVEYQIGNRRILAPFGGKLGMRNVSIGELVTPGTKI